MADTDKDGYLETAGRAYGRVLRSPLTRVEMALGMARKYGTPLAKGVMAGLGGAPVVQSPAANGAIGTTPAAQAGVAADAGSTGSPFVGQNSIHAKELGLVPPQLPASSSPFLPGSFLPGSAAETAAGLIEPQLPKRAGPYAQSAPAVVPPEPMPPQAAVTPQKDMPPIVQGVIMRNTGVKGQAMEPVLYSRQKPMTVDEAKAAGIIAPEQAQNMTLNQRRSWMATPPGSGGSIVEETPQQIRLVNALREGRDMAQEMTSPAAQEMRARMSFSNYLSQLGINTQREIKALSPVGMQMLRNKWEEAHDAAYLKSLSPSALKQEMSKRNAIAMQQAELYRQTPQYISESEGRTAEVAKAAAGSEGKVRTAAEVQSMKDAAAKELAELKEEHDRGLQLDAYIAGIRRDTGRLAFGSPEYSSDLDAAVAEFNRLHPKKPSAPTAQTPQPVAGGKGQIMKRTTKDGQQVNVRDLGNGQYEVVE